MSLPANAPAGLGSLPTPEGVVFRVWAPHASAVHVAGTFNDWNGIADPLTRTGDVWEGFVAGAKAGDEYKYRITNGDNDFWRVDPHAHQVTNSVGNGVVYDHAGFDWQGDDFSPSLLNDLVVYEMHVGSFNPEGPGPGTLADVVDKLEHLVRLGVNALQVMPIAEFAGDYSWGYNPAHVFAVESSYGGPDAFKTLVREAHNRGIAVILDVVYNHFGPSDLNLWQFDGWSENGKGGIYFYNDWRSATPWGDTRPDYGRGEVRSFIHDNAMSWVDNYHVDGLRFDMTPYIRSVTGFSDDIPEGWSLMKWINESVKDRHPRAITIAEDLHSNAAMTSHDGAGFSAQWDAQFVHPVRQAVIVADDEWRSVDSVANAITYSYGDPFARVIYTESHDEVANGQARVPSEVDWGDSEGYYAQKRSTLGAGLVFTSPGIPMIFQGQEFLENGWFRDNVPLDWEKDEQFRGIVRMYRDLVALRRNRKGVSKGLTGGNVVVHHRDTEGRVLAFQRWMDHGAGDDVVVVANLSHHQLQGYAVGMPTAGTWKLRFNSDADAYSENFSNTWSVDIDADDEPMDGMPATGRFAIGPYSMLVYSQDPQHLLRSS